MRQYILRRLLLIPVIMLLVSLMTAFAFWIISGSVAEIKCGLQCTPEVIAATEHEYGLDRSFFEQYGNGSASGRTKTAKSPESYRETPESRSDHPFRRGGSSAVCPSLSS